MIDNFHFFGIYYLMSFVSLPSPVCYLFSYCFCLISSALFSPLATQLHVAYTSSLCPSYLWGKSRPKFQLSSLGLHLLLSLGPLVLHHFVSSLIPSDTLKKKKSPTSVINCPWEVWSKLHSPLLRKAECISKHLNR